MIHTTDNFFNKVADEIRTTYFPFDSHSNYNNPNYRTATYTIELFNNGCLTYRKLVGRLAKCCSTTTKNIHDIVKKYILSFGEYTYQPKK